jgi:hypothetical protein
MVDPVPRGIRGERKVINGISVDFIVELEEDTEASVFKSGMRRFRENFDSMKDVLRLSRVAPMSRTP